MSFGSKETRLFSHFLPVKNFSEIEKISGKGYLKPKLEIRIQIHTKMPRQPRDTYKAHQHWVYEAHQQKEARALGDKLGLFFPNGSAGGPESDFM